MTGSANTHAIRNRRIAQDRKDGMSLRVIGELYGLTAERVHQILADTDAGYRQGNWGGGGNKRVKWEAPLRPRLTWRREIAERLRELQAQK